MSPLVTIGLPVFNAAPFLEDALRSIFAQTCADWELIAVDDGSRDGSAEVLQRVNDPRVKVLADGEHRGLGARLNQIVSQASGKYIARMDADDLMHPERLARQVAFLDEDPGIDVVGCGLISFDARQQPTSVRHLPLAHGDIMGDPLSGAHLAHASTIGRAEWWRKHLYNERNRGCEDWELWFTSRSGSRFANLPGLLYFYREEQAFSLAGYARDKMELAALQWSQSGEFGSSAMLAALGQFGRIGIYGLAQALGARRALIRWRGSPPTKEESAGFADALERIRSAILPESP